MFARMIVILALAATVSGCVAHKGVKFEWPDHNRRVVLMPLDIELSELNAGGLEVPNAEWTQMATTFFTQSLDERMTSVNASILRADDTLTAPKSQVQLTKLNDAVVYSILVHGTQGRPFYLPTKPTWTLGGNAAELKKHYNADYALFIKVRDSYTSGGRAAAIIVAAAFGVGMQGGSQRAHATLVDLETGDVVWHNQLFRGEGNMRDIDGARETTDKLLRGFPQ